MRDAALAYAGFLLDLAEDRDPLSRTVTIACTAPAATEASQGQGRNVGPAAATGQEAGRRAARTAQALTGLGVRAAVLDGAAVTALLSAAVDPYAPGDAGWPRTPPDAPVTGSSTLSWQPLRPEEPSPGEPSLVDPALVEPWPQQPGSSAW